MWKQISAAIITGALIIPAGGWANASEQTSTSTNQSQPSDIVSAAYPVASPDVRVTAGQPTKESTTFGLTITPKATPVKGSSQSMPSPADIQLPPHDDQHSTNPDTGITYPKPTITSATSTLVTDDSGATTVTLDIISQHPVAEKDANATDPGQMWVDMWVKDASKADAQWMSDWDGDLTCTDGPQQDDNAGIQHYICTGLPVSTYDIVAESAWAWGITHRTETRSDATRVTQPTSNTTVNPEGLIIWTRTQGTTKWHLAGSTYTTQLSAPTCTIPPQTGELTKPINATCQGLTSGETYDILVQQIAQGSKLGVKNVPLPNYTETTKLVNAEGLTASPITELATVYQPLATLPIQHGSQKTEKSVPGPIITYTEMNASGSELVISWLPFLPIEAFTLSSKQPSPVTCINIDSMSSAISNKVAPWCAPVGHLVWILPNETQEWEPYTQCDRPVDTMFGRMGYITCSNLDPNKTYTFAVQALYKSDTGLIVSAPSSPITIFGNDAMERQPDAPKVIKTPETALATTSSDDTASSSVSSALNASAGLGTNNTVTFTLNAVPQILHKGSETFISKVTSAELTDMYFNVADNVATGRTLWDDTTPNLFSFAEVLIPEVTNKLKEIEKQRLPVSSVGPDGQTMMDTTNSVALNWENYLPSFLRSSLKVSLDGVSRLDTADIQFSELDDNLKEITDKKYAYVTDDSTIATAATGGSIKCVAAPESSKGSVTVDEPTYAILMAGAVIGLGSSFYYWAQMRSEKYMKKTLLTLPAATEITWIVGGVLKDKVKQTALSNAESVAVWLNELAKKSTFNSYDKGYRAVGTGWWWGDKTKLADDVLGNPETQQALVTGMANELLDQGIRDLEAEGLDSSRPLVYPTGQKKKITALQDGIKAVRSSTFGGPNSMASPGPEGKRPMTANERNMLLLQPGLGDDPGSQFSQVLERRQPAADRSVSIVLERRQPDGAVTPEFSVSLESPEIEPDKFNGRDINALRIRGAAVRFDSETVLDPSAIELADLAEPKRRQVGQDPATSVVPSSISMNHPLDISRGTNVIDPVAESFKAKQKQADSLLDSMLRKFFGSSIKKNDKLTLSDGTALQQSPATQDRNLSPAAGQQLSEISNHISAFTPDSLITKTKRFNFGEALEKSNRNDLSTSIHRGGGIRNGDRIFYLRNIGAGDDESTLYLPTKSEMQKRLETSRHNTKESIRETNQQNYVDIQQEETAPVVSLEWIREDGLTSGRPGAGVYGLRLVVEGVHRASEVNVISMRDTNIFATDPRSDLIDPLQGRLGQSGDILLRRDSTGNRFVQEFSLEHVASVLGIDPDQVAATLGGRDFAVSGSFSVSRKIVPRFGATRTHQRIDIYDVPASSVNPINLDLSRIQSGGNVEETLPSPRVENYPNMETGDVILDITDRSASTEGRAVGFRVGVTLVDDAGVVTNEILSPQRDMVGDRGVSPAFRELNLVSAQGTAVDPSARQASVTIPVRVLALYEARGLRVQSYSVTTVHRSIQGKSTFENYSKPKVVDSGENHSLVNKLEIVKMQQQNQNRNPIVDFALPLVSQTFYSYLNQRLANLMWMTGSGIATVGLALGNHFGKIRESFYDKQVVTGAEAFCYGLKPNTNYRFYLGIGQGIRNDVKTVVLDFRTAPEDEDSLPLAYPLTSTPSSMELLINRSGLKWRETTSGNTGETMYSVQIPVDLKDAAVKNRSYRTFYKDPNTETWELCLNSTPMFGEGHTPMSSGSVYCVIEPTLHGDGTKSYSDKVVQAEMLATKFAVQEVRYSKEKVGETSVFLGGYRDVLTRKTLGYTGYAVQSAPGATQAFAASKDFFEITEPTVNTHRDNASSVDIEVKWKGGSGVSRVTWEDKASGKVYECNDSNGRILSLGTSGGSIITSNSATCYGLPASKDKESFYEVAITDIGSRNGGLSHLSSEQTTPKKMDVTVKIGQGARQKRTLEVSNEPVKIEEAHFKEDAKTWNNGKAPLRPYRFKITGAGENAALYEIEQLDDQRLLTDSYNIKCTGSKLGEELDIHALENQGVIANLPNGDTLDCSVRARGLNDKYSDATYSSTQARIVSEPGAPTSVQAEATSDSIQLTWTAPVVTGGFTPSYHIKYWDQAKPKEVESVVTAPGATTTKISKLNPGTHYQYEIRALHVTELTAGPYTATSTIRTKPGAPVFTEAPRASFTNNGQAITVAWNTPFDGGDPISEYEVICRSGSKSWTEGVWPFTKNRSQSAGREITQRVKSTGAASYTATITGIDSGRAWYDCGVQARNGIGTSNLSPFATVTKSGNPAPRDVVVDNPAIILGDRHFVVRWGSPTGNPLAHMFSQFRVYTSTDQGRSWREVKPKKLALSDNRGLQQQVDVNEGSLVRVTHIDASGRESLFSNIAVAER